jgi:hypothetical protein
MAEQAPAILNEISPSIISAIDKIIAPEQPAQAQQPAEQAPPQEQQPAAEAQATEQTEAAGNKQVEGEDAPAADEPAAGEWTPEQLDAIEFEVEITGEDGKKTTERPTAKELKLGYLRTKDYHRKTEDLARQRSQLGEEKRQAIEAERKAYVEQLEVLQKTLIETAAPELKDVNWNHLASNDAFEYVRLRNRADQLVGAVDRIQKAINEAKAKTQADAKTAHETAVKTAREKIAADIPDYNDALHAQLVKFGESAGFKAEEISNWTDPRATRLLHMAFQAQQKRPEPPPATKKTVVPPKAISPGASSAAQQARTRHSEAMQKLNKSGRVDDAAAVIAARLGL